MRKHISFRAIAITPEEYRKTVSNPYYNYGSIEDELEGKVPQRPGTVAP